MKHQLTYLCLLLSVASYVYMSAESIDATAITDFMMANYYQFANQKEKADKWYNRLAERTNSPYPYKGRIPLFYAQNKNKEIIKLIDDLDSVFAQDKDIQLIFAQALEKTGNHTASFQRLIKLNKQFPTNQEIAFKLIQLYLPKKEYEPALACIDAALNNAPRRSNDFIFYFLKSQVLVQTNKIEDALSSINICIENYPEFDKGWLLYAVIQEQKGALQEAIKGYSHFLQATTEKHKDIEQHLLSLAFKHRIAQSNQKINLASSKQCIESALLFFEKRKYGKALDHLNQCLLQSPDDPEARLLKIQTLTAQHNLKGAHQLLKTWLSKEPANQTWYDALHLLCRNGLAYKDAIATLEVIAKNNPQQLEPILYLADLSLRAHQQEYALTYLKQAAARTTDKDLKSKVLFQQAIVLYQKGAYPQAKELLIEAEKLTPHFAPVLNLLAYYYAKHERKFAQAHTLIDKALAKHKMNPHFLDTKAYVYYKENNFTQAHALFEKAAQQCPKDRTIMTHLHKTQQKLGIVKHAKRKDNKKYAKLNSNNRSISHT